LRPLNCIVGPTAAGKTALSLALAERLGAEIISADSAQVYRGMDIGSAKPAVAERARVPHWLIDVREPDEPYSAAEFAADAEAAILDIESRGRWPLVVGGTMLYVRALVHGLSPLPPADPALRAKLAAELAARGVSALHAELAQVDPVAAARIHRNDPQRILRALEVWRLTGTPISALQGAWRAPPRRPARLLALSPPTRTVLHRRIEQRVDRMIEAGLLAEVRLLMARFGPHRELPALRAVGYRQAWRHLLGEYDFATFRAKTIHATRQLAKRQLTWLRGEANVTWFDPDEPGVLERLLASCRATV
jgi:tRNA dimethylallyltransferase